MFQCKHVLMCVFFSFKHLQKFVPLLFLVFRFPYNPPRPTERLRNHSLSGVHLAQTIDADQSPVRRCWVTWPGQCKGRLLITLPSTFITPLKPRKPKLAGQGQCTDRHKEVSGVQDHWRPKGITAYSSSNALLKHGA